MPGIERIHIKSTWDDEYIQKNRNMEPTANALHPLIFEGIGMPLCDAEVASVTCTKDEAKARYDWQEGIDVILHFTDGARATMQEKFLTFPRSTLTFETVKTNGQAGAWYYCTAQYYFVGYAKFYDAGDYSFQDWMLVDFPLIRRIDARQQLPWHQNRNNHMNRRSQFKFLDFRDVPAECIVAKYETTTATLQPDLFGWHVTATATH